MKKFRSNWFRVATEGMTTDGREIERVWIEQMAATYDRTKYGARIWLEHFRGILPDGPFKAYGDVLSLKTEEVEVDGKKKLGLFAQIEPTDDLIALNKAKQKIYTSVEIQPNFTGGGKAYLMGLAVTDTPASIGTEALAFSAKNPDASPFKGRKENPENLFAETIEAELQFEEVDDQVGAFTSLKNRVSELLGKNKEKDGLAAANFAELGGALEGLLTHATQQAEVAVKTSTALTTLQQLFTALQTELTDLKTKLGGTQDHTQTQRPPVTGDQKSALTEF